MSEGGGTAESAFSRAELSWLSTTWVWTPDTAPLPVNTRVVRTFDQDGLNGRLVEKVNDTGQVVGAAWVFRGFEGAALIHPLIPAGQTSR